MVSPLSKTIINTTCGVGIAGYCISAIISAYLPTAKYANEATGETCPVFVQHSAIAASFEYTSLDHCRWYWVFGFWWWIVLPVVVITAIIVRCFVNVDD